MQFMTKPPEIKVLNYNICYWNQVSKFLFTNIFFFKIMFSMFLYWIQSPI
jgi:hypothetical protein